MKLTFLGTRGYIDARTPCHAMHTSTMLSYRGRRVMIDCGEDWLGRLDAVLPHAIVITHAHPDHAFGCRHGSPCPVYATEEAWNAMAGFRIPESRRRVLRIRKRASIAGIIFEPFPVSHSVRAPAVGFRVTAGGARLFYVLDVAEIPDKSRALSGIQTYIGDGATLLRPMLRKDPESHQVIGHASVKMQLRWCHEEGVSRMIVTHCGSGIVTGSPTAIGRTLRNLAREFHVKITLAYDGLEVVNPWQPRKGGARCLLGRDDVLR